MIKKLAESSENVLGFEVDGKVDLSEEMELISQVENVLDKHAKVSVLVILNDQAKWGIEAGYEDLKWAMTHIKSFHRIAIVSDTKIWEWLVAMDSPFAAMLGIGEKHFDLANLDKAWEWVKE
ncbi:SpoIIAA-like [Pseudovibrio ascidiaceicola]|uniref:SpoIIAA-like n=1 Tax=Pseudovibrio ascidiaceicola TaxID=285279 RepID=A0A1I4DN58_9HYPH|nr:STAS/SEC14 domain-containing protein [Pseudovibrio ascidiaceicola]SFK93767.1 SpoIIAA-like [Pseudovibrio ascidiaceicola]